MQSDCRGHKNRAVIGTHKETLAFSRRLQRRRAALDHGVADPRHDSDTIAGHNEWPVDEMDWPQFITRPQIHTCLRLLRQQIKAQPRRWHGLRARHRLRILCRHGLTDVSFDHHDPARWCRNGGDSEGKSHKRHRLASQTIGDAVDLIGSLEYLGIGRVGALRHQQIDHFAVEVDVRTLERSLHQFA